MGWSWVSWLVLPSVAYWGGSKATVDGGGLTSTTSTLLAGRAGRAVLSAISTSGASLPLPFLVVTGILLKTFLVLLLLLQRSTTVAMER